MRIIRDNNRITKIEKINDETFKYNRRGDVVYHKKGDNYERKLIYDVLGNLVSMSSTDGVNFYLTKDICGDLIYLPQINGEEKPWYKYDENDNLIYARDINNTEYNFEYDENGKITKLHINAS